MWDPKYRSKDSDHRWTETDATEASVRRITNNFAYYAKWKGKPRFVNKHPRNSLRVPFLMTGWPDAHIVCVQRDPRAVVWSLVSRTRREGWRSRYPLGQFARPPGWREIDDEPDPVRRFSLAAAAIHETLQRDLRRCVPPTQLHIVRYEDFVADTRGTVAATWKACGLDAPMRSLEAIPARLTNMNAKWKRDMTEKQIATMEPIVEPILNDLGYAAKRAIKASA